MTNWRIKNYRLTASLAFAYGLGLLAFVGLLACGAEKHGGTSTETTNGGVAGVLSVNGAPLSGARIVLLSVDGMPSEFSTTTDEQGFFALEPDSGRYHIWASSIDSTFASLDFGVKPGIDTMLRLQALPTGNAQWRNLLPGDSVHLLGTPFGARVNENGWADMQRLPAGHYTLATAGATLPLPKTIGTLRMGASESIIQTMPVQSDGILLEDFADGDALHALAPFTGRGDWYISTEGNTQLDWPPGSSNFPLAIDAQGAWRDASLYLQYSTPPSDIGDTLGRDGLLVLGVHVAEQPLDLQWLDSVSFWARGNGTLQVGLEEEFSPGQFHKAVWNVTLDSNWTRIVLPTTEPIASPEYTGHVPFAEVAPRVELLSFFLRGGTWFGLDEIRLH